LARDLFTDLIGVLPHHCIVYNDVFLPNF